MMSSGRAFMAFSISIFLLSAASLAGAAVESMSFGSVPASESVPNASGARAAAPHGGGYIIRNSHGHVMLYDATNNEPIRELDISYCDLPPEDRALLDSGLLVEDADRLLSLLEDYTG